MTIIEFFDENSIENIAGALLCRPKRVVFVGDGRKRIERSIENYRSVLLSKGIDSELLYRPISRYNLKETADSLADMVNDYGECVFDLSGGDEIYLAAVGVLSERLGEKIQCHRFNYRNGALSDIDADGQICRTTDTKITVEDNIKIYGGRMTSSTAEDSLSDKEFMQDVRNMWEVCRKDARAWNAHTASLGALLERLGLGGGLMFSFEKEKAKGVLEGSRTRFAYIRRIMEELEEFGLVKLSEKGDRVSVGFKNRRIKKCLTTAGLVLEYTVMSAMLEVKDKDGERAYDDVRSGVKIDWDGEDKTDEVRTVNEVDVLAMRGMTPIFISCKNGDFDMEELYKLSSVTQRFGGRYGKKVLVTTDTDKLGQKADYLRARMNDMGIRCIDNADKMTGEELVRALSNI